MSIFFHEYLNSNIKDSINRSENVRTKNVQRWVEDELKKDNLTPDEIRSLENAREKTLLTNILSKTSPEAKILNSIDVIMDKIKPEYRKIRIMSLYTIQESNEILRLNKIYDNMDSILKSKNKITVIRFNGKDILSDGNHRVNALLKLNITDVMVNYYDYDKYKNNLKD